MDKDTGTIEGKTEGKGKGKGEGKGETRALRKGDTVEWSTSHGKTRGTVVKKVTGTAKIEGHVAKASTADPQYEVESEKSGKHAIHRPDALKKV
jgi:hypothetical protein